MADPAAGTAAGTAVGTAQAPPRVPALSTRLAVAVALILAAGGGAVALAALAYGRQAAQQAYDRLLIGAASQIAAAIAIKDGRVVVDMPLSAFELLALAPDDRVVYAVIGEDGALITGYGDVARPPELSDVAYYQGEFRGEPVRLAAVRRRFAERAFSGAVDVVVGQTTRARAALARDIAQNALLLAGGAGVVMSALAAFAIRSALSPLRRIARSLAEREPRDLTPLDLAVPREIDPLVAAINRFMARLEQQMTVMRILIADASHQLRTPIAGLRAQAELAAEETDPERQRRIVARIHERSLGLSRLTDQLLSHALIIHRADAAPLERLDLREVAIRAADESDHDRGAEFDAGATALALDLPEDPVWVQGDAFSLVEACKNLVTNAYRHGAPPVRVVVAREGAQARIGVRDGGPGPPTEHWADAGARFARQSAVSPQSAGLGLAIVHTVAKAHGGALCFARPAEGGFEAALILPGGPAR